MPRVSVVVPCYNHVPYLRQQMESILGQTFQDYELILLDDNSTDGSRDLLDTYRSNPHVAHTLYNRTNSGSPFSQWKKGIGLAQGEWVWIAESDDWAEPTFLETLVAAADRWPTCGIVGSNPIYVYPDGHRWQRPISEAEHLYTGSDFLRQRLALANTLPNASALLIRRECLQRLDLAEAKQMRVCGDWLIYLGLCKIADVLELSASLSYFRQHTDNTSLRCDPEGRTIEEWCCISRHLATHLAKSPSLCRQWGKMWAKQERADRCPSSTRRRLRHLPWPSRSIKLWHHIYHTKYLWQP